MDPVSAIVSVAGGFSLGYGVASKRWLVALVGGVVTVVAGAVFLGAI